MMSTTKKTIACFGATGGCVGAALACALKEGHSCTALARTPEKLRDFMLKEHNVPLSVLEQHLTIFRGDVKDPVVVTKVLKSPVDAGALVDVILSGVGAFPTFQLNIRDPFPLTDPTICEDAIRTIFSALSDLLAANQSQSRSGKPLQKPLLVAITTGGCGRRRGVPMPILWPYHYLLGSPLADKKRMEALVFRDYGAYVRDFVIMRPLFLTEGEPKGDDGLRVGWEWGIEENNRLVKEPGPVLGYTISKKDVGTWTFNKVIVQGGCEGKCVYLAH